MGKLQIYSERSFRLLHYVSDIALFAVMALLIVNILMRALFNAPIFGTYEFISVMSLVLIVCALSYTENTSGNVTVTLILEYLRPKTRNIFEIIGNSICTVMAGIIAYDEFMLIHSKFVKGDMTDNLHIPQWILVAVLAIGFILLTLCLLIKVIVRIAQHRHMSNEKVDVKETGIAAEGI
jgi:TRAP-type C4-dicarboxylate transport system permease small subunit